MALFLAAVVRDGGHHSKYDPERQDRCRDIEEGHAQSQGAEGNGFRDPDRAVPEWMVECGKRRQSGAAREQRRRVARHGRGVEGRQIHRGNACRQEEADRRGPSISAFCHVRTREFEIEITSAQSL
jgi:hypothetical protein